MSWLIAARDVVARWGTPARFAVRQIVINAFPGGSIAAELLDDLLECSQEIAEDQEEAESRAQVLATREELRRAGEVLAEVNGRLSRLIEQVTHMDGLPEAADRLIRVALATDEEVRTGFARVEWLVGGLDRIEEQGREILRRVGYGNDLQETILALIHRQSVVVEFVEELRAGGARPWQLGEMLATFSACLTASRA